MASPLYGELSSMPPSLIIADGDEIMLSDAQSLQEKLLKAGRRSQLVVKPERWHAYLLYDLEEDRQDYTLINRFLNQFMSR